MYFRIYNNMNIKVLTFTRLCYFVFLVNWFHMIISFLHKPGQVSRCMALVPPVFCTGLWMACLNLTGQPLHKGRNWGSGMGQQPVLSYCIMWRDHVAWPCGVKCFYTPVWKTGRIMPWQCPSVRLSVRPSVRPSAFSGLFFNMLWDINLKLGICIQ